MAKHNNFDWADDHGREKLVSEEFISPDQLADSERIAEQCPELEARRLCRHGENGSEEYTPYEVARADCEKASSPGAELDQVAGSESDGREPNERPEVTLDDFVAFMPEHSYIFVPARQMWPAASVNARLDCVVVNGKKVQASAWLDSNRPVEQMTWAPGQPLLIENKLIAEGGWIDRKGCTVFNLYRPPNVIRRAGPITLWSNHLQQLFGEDSFHITCWLAHRIQRPHEKINHALVLGGDQGIGKDTILEPVKRAVGAWNFIEVTPQQVLGRFNGFAKSVILRVSEARDLGDADRFAFYDHMKIYTAAPPDVLRIDEKHRHEYSAPNVCGVIITTNHKADGIYLPADDRRHFVAWSSQRKEDFTQDYWANLWRWIDATGADAVAAYLASLDISSFNPKAPPPKTNAFWEIVNVSRAPETAELASVLDKLGWPKVITLTMLVDLAEDGFGEWLRDRRNAERFRIGWMSANIVQSEIQMPLMASGELSADDRLSTRRRAFPNETASLPLLRSHPAFNPTQPISNVSDVSGFPV